MLTQNKVAEFIRYDPETGEASWKVSRGSVKSGDRIDCKDGHGYLMVRIDGVLHRLHRVVWVLQFWREPKGVIDHINGDKSDNRLKNLRECTQRFNVYNSCVPKHNTSGYKGVSFCKRRQKFRANLYANQKQQFLGYYDTAEEAAGAYEEHARVS